MEVFLNVIIFTIGCFLGSFFTLAVYRIPRKEDILIKHSYCPNCNHKLGFFDLFPLLSYIFLGGKCRYCKNKIRPRYFILEIFSGITFLMLFLSLKPNIYNLEFIKIAAYFIYFAVLFIIAGIDKEYTRIEKGPLLFGYLFELTYIIYTCALNNIDVYRYVIYLIFMIILLLFSIISLKRNMNEKYFIQVLFLSLYMIMFGGSTIFVLSTILTLLSLGIVKVINKKSSNTAIGFYLCVSNMLVIIVTNYICNYIMI